MKKLWEHLRYLKKSKIYKKNIEELTKLKKIAIKNYNILLFFIHFNLK
jgi:hypothetical protein